MPRYIDTDALLEDIDQTVRFSCRDGVPNAEMRGANKIIDRIKAAPTLSPDDVRGVGEWEDNYPILVELECLRCKNCNKLVQIGRYCANCGERKKGAETWIKKKSRSQST